MIILYVKVEESSEVASCTRTVVLVQLRLRNKYKVFSGVLHLTTSKSGRDNCEGINEANVSRRKFRASTYEQVNGDGRSRGWKR